MRILGVSAYYHDAAAALVIDGKIVAAAQEERFTRRKYDARFPHAAIRACINIGRLDARSIDLVVFYEKPFLKFERLLETYLAFAPRGFGSFRRAVPLWLKEKLFLKNLLVQEMKQLEPDVDWLGRLMFSEHHLSHAASAFYPSPFERAAVLTMDGVGEWTTTSVALGSSTELKIVREIHFPHSLGLLYSAFTYYTGFKVNSGEYKLMGLAPYGEPRFAATIREHLIDVKDDGSFRLNLDYFDYCTGLRMTNERFAKLFGGAARNPDDPLTQRDMDLAASIQVVTEEIVLKLAQSVARETGEKNVCLAGGVALNCVANGKLLKNGCFDRLWLQPAAGDAGGALGAALVAAHSVNGEPRHEHGAQDGMLGSYLGPEYSQDEIERRLITAGAVFTTLSGRELIEGCVTGLADGKALGWHQGRMEFGPRALGNRSILADARSPTMQKVLNLKIKYRESFRPFAPSVLREDLVEWFDIDVDSPYMLLVADVLAKHRRAVDGQQQLSGIDRLGVLRSSIPAVTHVDNSARVQTVHSDTNPRFHALLTAFRARTGCPMLVNTSFNVRGEPIVCTPEDAFHCFMGTELDFLAVGNCLLDKEAQNLALLEKYHHRVAAD